VWLSVSDARDSIGERADRALLPATRTQPEASMRRFAIIIGGLATLAIATTAHAQSPRDSIVATVNDFFRAMTTRDTAALRRVQFPDGVQYAARIRGDSVAIRRGTFEVFAAQLATMSDTYLERMWEPTVLVHGPLAVVWAPYDFHRNGTFTHCGVDAFTLMRSPTGWKIATVSYTTEPTGCPQSPLGPPR
jgi:hypothetical protein